MKKNIVKAKDFYLEVCDDSGFIIRTYDHEICADNKISKKEISRQLLAQKDLWIDTPLKFDIIRIIKALNKSYYVEI